MHPRSLLSGSTRLFVFFIKQSALFQYNSSEHTTAVTYCRESSFVTYSSSNAGETPLVPCLLLLWKAFVVLELLLFCCVLASCWHCKSKTVAPSGASATVAPGTVSCRSCRDFQLSISTQAVFSFTTKVACFLPSGILRKQQLAQKFEQKLYKEERGLDAL